MALASQELYTLSNFKLDMRMILIICAVSILNQVSCQYGGLGYKYAVRHLPMNRMSRHVLPYRDYFIPRRARMSFKRGPFLLRNQGMGKQNVNGKNIGCMCQWENIGEVGGCRIVQVKTIIFSSDRS